MSLAGRKGRKAFWGTLIPVLISITLLAVAAGFGIWNSVSPIPKPTFTELRIIVPIATTVLAALLTGLDRYFAGKISKRSAEAVAQDALEVLSKLESAMGSLSADDKFQAYFDDLIKECGPKLFRERDVRLGFFVLEAGDFEEGEQPQFLRKRSSFDLSNGMPLQYVAGADPTAGRDHALEMIQRTRGGKDLMVKNIYKDAADWIRLERKEVKSYRCFVSAPVLDSKKNKALGLLTVDAPRVGDLTADDSKWVRVLAGMLSHGLTDESAEVPIPMSPLRSAL